MTINRNRCPSCGREWAEHPGIEPTCRQLHKARSAIRVIWTWASCDEVEPSRHHLMSLCERTLEETKP